MKPKVYLAGPIEYEEDRGTTWRNEVRVHTENSNYNLHIIDPIDLNQDTEADLARATKSMSDQLYMKTMSIMIDRDLHFAKKCDFLLVKWNPLVRITGTISEITVAYLNRLPVIFVLPPGYDPNDLPGWIMPMITKIFNSHTAAIDYIASVTKEWAMEN